VPRKLVAARTCLDYAPLAHRFKPAILPQSNCPTPRRWRLPPLGESLCGFGPGAPEADRLLKTTGPPGMKAASVRPASSAITLGLPRRKTIAQTVRNAIPRALGWNDADRTAPCMWYGDLSWRTGRLCVCGRCCGERANDYCHNGQNGFHWFPPCLPLCPRHLNRWPLRIVVQIERGTEAPRPWSLSHARSAGGYASLPIGAGVELGLKAKK